MKRQIFALLVGFALTPIGAGAQQPATDTTPGATTATLPTPRPAAGFVQPKTPWGDPDLQGF
jgi:hypothetical protein